MKRLHSLEPAEVSLVPRGANKKKFLILKSEDGASMTKEQLLEALKKTPAAMKAVEAVLKAHMDGLKKDDSALPEATEAADPKMDERLQMALKAVARILAPFKDSLSPDLLAESLESAGIEMGGGDEMAKDGDEDLEDGDVEMADKKKPDTKEVSNDHHLEALGMAKKAYQDHITKLGYRKYPDAEMAQKKDMEDCEKAAKADQEETDMGEVEKSGIMKGVDLSKIPEGTRPAIEAIFKSQQELVKKNEELATKNDSLNSELAMVKKQALRKEFVAKAEGLKHLGIPTEELAEDLLNLSQLSPELYAKVEKTLTLAKTTVEKSALFEEIGTTQSGKIGPTFEAIEKAAEGYVAKSGEKVSKSEAVDKYLRTPEGSRMYNEYMSEHASAKRS